MQVRNIFYDRIDTAPSLCLGSDKYHTLAMIRNPASYLWDGGRESSEKDAVVFLLPGQQIEIVRSSESFVYELVEFIPENWECDIPPSLRLPAPVNFPSAVIHLSASVKLMYDTFYSADNFRLEKICPKLREASSRVISLTLKAATIGHKAYGKKKNTCTMTMPLLDFAA